MADKIGDAYVELSLRVEKLEQNLKQAEKKTDQSANKMSDSFKKIGTSIAGVLGGLLAFRTALRFMRDATQLARTQERAFRRLEQQVVSTGKSAGYTANQLQRMAGELQNVSNFGDEDIMENAVSSLLKFQSISGEVFKDALRLTVDMAEMTGNLSGAAEMLGRALEDPARGVTRLARAGVIFTAEQQEMIQNFAETNQLAKAQEMILKQVEGIYGGMAKAMVEPTVQLRNVWGDIKEEVGFGFVRATNEAASRMLPFLSEMQERMRDLRLSAEDLREEVKGMSAEELKEMRDRYREIYYEGEKIESVVDVVIAIWRDLNNFINEEFIPNLGTIIKTMSPMIGIIDLVDKGWRGLFPGKEGEEKASIWEKLGQAIYGSDRTQREAGEKADELHQAFIKQKLRENEEIQEFNRNLKESAQNTGAIIDLISDFDDELDIVKPIVRTTDLTPSYESVVAFFEKVKQEEDSFLAYGLANLERMENAWAQYIEGVIEKYGEGSREHERAVAQMEEHLEKYGETSEKVFKEVINLSSILADRFSSAIADSIWDAIEGTKNFADAFWDMTKRILMDIGRMITQMLILNALFPGIGGIELRGLLGFNTGGTVPGFNTGGTVPGDPTKHHDSVLAWLTPREEIINRDSAEYGINRFLLKAVNRDKMFFDRMIRGIGFNAGGTVSGDTHITMPSTMPDRNVLREIQRTNRLLSNIKLTPVIINKISPVEINRANNLGERIRGGR